MVTAQVLYDRREERGEISGSELHALFEQVCGDPSPAGQTPIELLALRQAATDYRQRYAAHKASGGCGGTYLLDIAAFAEEAAVQAR